MPFKQKKIEKRKNEKENAKPLIFAK